MIHELRTARGATWKRAAIGRETAITSSCNSLRVGGCFQVGNDNLRRSWRFKAKPATILGCELFIQIGGEMPVDGERDVLALDTRISYTHDNAASDANKAAFYCGEGTNAKGETGGWGPVASATVAV